MELLRDLIDVRVLAELNLLLGAISYNADAQEPAKLSKIPYLISIVISRPFEQFERTERTALVQFRSV